jgi:hypothetical protein
MATTIEVSWYPVGGGITIVVTLDPTPSYGAHVWIFVDSVTSGQVGLGQLETDVSGVAPYNFRGLNAGAYTVEAGFAILAADPGDPPAESNSEVWPDPLILQPAPIADPPALPTQPSALDPSQVGVQGPMLGDAGARMQTGSNAFNGVSNVDPFTGVPAIDIDPYTGEPLPARDASISDRIRAVYRQPDAVPEATRYAILDSYFHPIDLTGVPQSVQNSIFDIFNQAAEPPLPGRGP